jgi:transcriptional regulator with XRE-family HTH domain
MADYYGAEARAARAVRAKVRGTQNDFATLLGIPPGTVRNWEHGRRKPTGTARVLLQLIEAEPEIVGGLLRRIRRAAAPAQGREQPAANVVVRYRTLGCKHGPHGFTAAS